MAGGDETLAAATAILQGLAREVPRTNASSPPSSDQEGSSPSANGFETKRIKLPGESSPAKAAFEKELEALTRRIHLLEQKAVSVPTIPPLPISSSFGVHASLLVGGEAD